MHVEVCITICSGPLPECCLADSQCCMVSQEYIKLLEREKSRMEDRWREGVKLFRQWKDHLLVDTVHSNTIPAFIGHCLLPRCILTPEDAMYCAAFIRRMALEDTPYFSFMLCAQTVRPALMTWAAIRHRRCPQGLAGVFHNAVFRLINLLQCVFHVLSDTFITKPSKGAAL